MRKTFTTTMPNKVGAFLTAGKVFAALNLNITRVSYNKAVDSHMLFIEADGDSDSMNEATEKLKEIGYISDSASMGNVILIEFRLKDVPGTVEPILEIIENHNINISYLSSRSDGSGYQNFRMGLFIHNNEEISDLIKSASALCDVKIIDYDPAGISLDNTVFYISFANKISDICKLNESEKKTVMIESNMIMEMLTKENKPPYKTFEYIGKFAEAMINYKNENFSPRITEYNNPGYCVTLIEPPCGSNICLIKTETDLICVDGGFTCYKDEAIRIIKQKFPDFDFLNKVLILTHADIDHVGIAEYFDCVYVSKKCYNNFVNDDSKTANIREQNPYHAPYVRISKILSHYKPIQIGKLRVIGGRNSKLLNLSEKIGCLNFGKLQFECIEFKGGHVQGETVYIDRYNHTVFTGDILVNIKGFTVEQRKFNALAPYLMTSVDTDKNLAAEERKKITEILSSGHWMVFGGHGAPQELDI